MKAKTKLTKLWSFLLALVMLLSLLPTTAFAAGSAETKTTDVTDYGSLETAMSDKTTDVVRLTEDIILRDELDTIFYIYKSKTLDLSGHTITVPDGKEINFWYYADADIKIMNSSTSSSAKIIGNHTGASSYALLYGAIIRDAEKVNFVIDGVDFEVKNNNFTTVVFMKNGQKYENLIIKNSNVNGNQYLFWSGAAKKVYLESITLKGADRNQYRQLSNTSSLTVNDVIDANAVIEYYPSAGVKATADRTAILNASDLNAYWGPITVKVGTPVVYTITFNSNDGTSVAPQNIKAGEKLTEPTPAPTKAGFTFDGWYEDSTFSTKFDFNTPITDNMTLYAKWTENKYTLTFDANGGSGTMTPVTDLTGEYTLPANGFTAPAGKQFKAWSVGGVEKAAGDKITVTANTTVTAVWEAIEYNITVTDGKATVGAGTPITKATIGTTVTLTANAAPSGKVFDKWEVVSGGITLADANSTTTTFTMPASAVSVKATYKNAPHTHTYNQKTVKPEALKIPADCTGNAVYFKSCSCGAISTTDAFVAMNTALGHAYGSDWKYDSTNHWHECSRCHDKKYEAAHDYGSDNVCDTCGYAKTVTHTHNLTLVAAKAATCTTAGNSAYYTCDGCDKWFADATGSVEITDKTSVKIPAPGHTAGTEWKSDDTNHWHECSRCHDKKDEAAHDYGSDNVCDTCGYAKTVPHTHNLTLVAAKAATCTEGGKEAYYKCEGCGKFYEDVLGTKEITDLASWGNIAKIAHTTKQTVTKATPTANGEIVNYCSVCKKTLSTTVIPKASSIKLKATSLTYNGKVRTPKVIVKDITGKTLVKNTNYTVSYAKGRKYVGKYAVKITFKGKYSGTKTLYFTIKPKATSISSLKAGSKKFTVKWKKQATQTTGYQVQYSASSKFSKAKTVTVGKNKTVSKKISKLSGKKKYYVRVRTYKTVKINGKSIRIYSGWSKAKTVTTKK